MGAPIFLCAKFYVRLPTFDKIDYDTNGNILVFNDQTVQSKVSNLLID